MSQNQDSYFSWLSSSCKNSLTFLTSSSEFVYFAFFILEMEDEGELNKNLWPILVAELKLEDSSLEPALKAASKKVGDAKLDSNYLAIYRWSKQLLDTTDEHNLLAVFAQRFFGYYLARPLPDGL